MTYCNEDTNADKLAAYDYALEARALEIYESISRQHFKYELIEAANNDAELNHIHDAVIMGSASAINYYPIAARRFVDAWLMKKATELAEKELGR